MNAPKTAFWRLDALLILGLALAVRLVYQLHINGFPYINVPAVDAQDYLEWARRIAGGDWLGKEVFFQAPGYPYFIGALFALAGPRIEILQFFQQFLGAVTCVFVYAAARQLFNRPAALIAAALAAVYGIHVFYAGFAIKPALQMFLLAGLLALLSRQTRGVSNRHCLFAGLLLGLATLVIANMALLAPFLMAWLFWIEPGETWKRRLLPPFWLGVGVSLALFPVAVRNYAVAHDFVILSSQGGMNLYIGNNPAADGVYKPLYPEFANMDTEAKYSRLAAEKEAGRALKQSEVSQYWARKAWKFILGTPEKFLKLKVRTFRIFWNAYEVPDTESFYFFHRFSPLLRWLPGRFGWIAVAGLAAIPLAVRDRRSLLPPLMVLGMMAITIPFFVLARYRLPVALPLLMLTGAGVVGLIPAVREKRWRALCASAAILAGSAWLVYSPFPIAGFKDAEISTQFYNLGVLARENGAAGKALDYFRRSAEASGKSYLARKELMETAFRNGDLKEARRRAQEILAINFSQPAAWFMMGQVSEREGKTADARTAYQQCLRADSSYPGAAERLAALAPAAA